MRLKVNARARRISLRVDRLGREAIATAPSQALLAKAAAFAEARQAWLSQQMAAAPAEPPPQPGASIAVFGGACRLDPDGRRPRLMSACDDTPRRIVGCGDEMVDLQLVSRAIKREALEVYRVRVAAHCQKLGAAVPLLTVTDTRSRWGSCSPARPGRAASVRLSWRLALAPFEVADYVVAHECAHLLEANHGPRFWGHVRSLVGDHRPHRGWLRIHGARLQGFGG